MLKSLASQFMPMKVIIMQMKPIILITEAGVPRHDGTLIACRYMANTVHVIRAHVSFGSQPQYLPHASFAQRAPEKG